VNTQNDSLASLDIELKRLQLRREQLALDDELASRARTAKVVDAAQATSAAAVKTTKTFATFAYAVVVFFLTALLIFVFADWADTHGGIQYRLGYYVTWAAVATPVFLAYFVMKNGWGVFVPK
jgi:hypothetical protein